MKLMEGNPKRKWEELNLLIVDYLDMYENHLDFLEIDLESDDQSWLNIFDIRTRLLGLFTDSGYVNLSVALNKRKVYQKHCEKLRHLDRILIKKAPLIVSNFNIFSFRQYLIEEMTKGIGEEVPEPLFNQTFWWWALDLILSKKLRFPDYVPSWLKKPKTYNLDAVIVEGRTKGEKKYVVLLFLPSKDIPRVVKKRLLEELADNLLFDITSLIDRVSITEKKETETYLILLLSGFIGKLQIKTGLQSDVFKGKELLVAFPRKDSIFFSTFFEELEEAVKSGNTKFLNHRTLTQEQFIIKQLDYAGFSIQIDFEKSKPASSFSLNTKVPSEVTLVSD